MLLDKDKIINLTQRLYKITLLFPKKEPLRYRIREQADEVLKNAIVLAGFSGRNPESAQKELNLILLKDLEILNSYFEIAKYQNWSYFDVLELQNEYARINEQFKTAKSVFEFPEKVESPVLLSLPVLTRVVLPEEDRGASQNSSEPELGVRQKKIMGILKNHEKIQVGELQNILKDVSKRTLRRDFIDLIKKGFVRKIGDRNDTFYQLRIR